MSIQVKRRRDAASFLSTFTGAAGELLVDTTNSRVQVHDGSTPGGFPAAKLSEVPCAPSPHAANIQFGVLEELVTVSGASAVSTIQIPNRAIVFAVSVRVVAAVTGATSYNVDATTTYNGSVGATGGQFGANLGISAGSINSGVVGPTAWYAPSTITLTANGGGFTGGQVRVAIQYALFGAPTS
ncbi:hypothetical protein RZS28_09355 [Methylocapsa polymorpha]|uniref:Major tropism determinant N-terminal domain-containing protein n=1 Tax=Methylocapsa polymorpha TaxID=3080828 RepID=A0ABZ0HN81_9HYPH|nr:hypothetical protein RZS28_09355 [Methylocapsa sp. RX1]